MMITRTKIMMMMMILSSFHFKKLLMNFDIDIMKNLPISQSDASFSKRQSGAG